MTEVSCAEKRQLLAVMPLCAELELILSSADYSRKTWTEISFFGGRTRACGADNRPPPPPRDRGGRPAATSAVIVCCDLAEIASRPPLALIEVFSI